MEETLSIAELARTCAVGVETVRYYQRRGLLDTPDRPAGGIRRYGEAHAARLRFVRRAREIGFSLDDVGVLLRLERAPDCGQARQLALMKLAQIEATLVDLQRMRKSLRTMIIACADGRDPRSCPIVESIIRTAA